MVLERVSRHRRARQLVAAVLAIAAAFVAPREATSQPITPSRPRQPETIPLFPRPTTPPRDVIEDSLAARDAELGLGPSGQVVATVNRVAFDRAPRNGRGIVRVLIDENGRVSSVTSTSPSWDEAAMAIRQQLAGRRFALPRGVRNVVLSFDVVARSTQVPAVFTGESSPAPVSWPQSLQGTSRFDAPPQVAVVPVESLLPVPRHVVNVSLLRVERR